MIKLNAKKVGIMMENNLKNSACFNKKGQLEFAGYPIEKLAKEFGTPLFVYDVQMIRQKARGFKKTFEELEIKHKVTYASKAFTCLAIYQVIKEEGLACDVVSAGEMYTALKAGILPKDIVFHGNNKLMSELEMAIENNIGTIVIDNFYELTLLKKILRQKKKQQQVLLRVAPGVDAHTHSYILTGQEDSKFGFDILSGQADEALQLLLEDDVFNVAGVHCHIGSQIFSTDGFQQATNKMMSLMLHWQQSFGYTARILNLGGGFGVHYTDSDQPLEAEEYVKQITNIVKQSCSKNDFPLPEIWIEPGRSIVAEAGITIYTTGAQKHIPNVRSFISVDGGMADNIRPALYQAEYTGTLATKKETEKMQVVSITGKYCESGDIIIRDITVPEIESGDLFVVFSTGAYGYSMASNYNRSLRPAVVFIENQQAQLVIRRETLDDIIQYDLPYTP